MICESSTLIDHATICYCHNSWFQKASSPFSFTFYLWHFHFKTRHIKCFFHLHSSKRMSFAILFCSFYALDQCEAKNKQQTNKTQKKRGSCKEIVNLMASFEKVIVPYLIGVWRALSDLSSRGHCRESARVVIRGLRWPPVREIEWSGVCIWCCTLYHVIRDKL